MKKKILPIFFMVFSVYLFLYVFYKSEFYWNGDKRNYYLIYYFISFLLIVTSAITFFINKKLKTYLIIILISIVFTLYAFETYLILGGNDQLNIKKIEMLNKKIELYKKRTGKDDYDTREIFNVYKDLKKKDNSVQVAAYPYLNEDLENKIFPLSGVSNVPTILCNENGYYAIYESDRYGFNNPDEDWDKKEIEFLLIGDSHAHGACVNRPNDLSSVLSSLSNKPSLSIGYGGNSILFTYATLREYLRTNVKYVLWIYLEPDIEDLNRELKYIAINKYLVDLNYSQNLKSKQNEINEILIKKISIEENKYKNNFNLLKFIKLNQLRIIMNSYLPKKYQPIHAPKPLPYDKFEEIMILTNDLVKKNKSKLYFVYLPDYQKIKDDKIYQKQFNQIKKIIEDLNIEFIDIYKEVHKKTTNAENLFSDPMRTDGGHANVEGYNKIGNAIFKIIVNNNKVNK